MNIEPLHWIQKGSEIAGAGISPALSASFALNDGTGGALAQLGVVVGIRLKAFVMCVAESCA